MNAAVVGYFNVDSLLSDFYDSYAAALHGRGFTVKGIELGNGRCSTSTGIQTIVINNKRHASWFFVREVLRLPVCWFSNRELFIYITMQTQPASLREWLRSYVRLRLFRKNFKDYLVREDVRHVLLNHQFSGFHLIAREVCEQLSVPFAYWHPGFLPGTMSFDYTGQLAESEFHKQLLECGLTERADWIELGNRYLKWAREGTYRRPGKSYKSNAEVIDYVRIKKKRSSHIILVVGTNDYRAGILPAEYERSDIHSRYYKSSDVLFRDTVSVTDEDSFVIYKPHPNVHPGRSGVQELSGRSAMVFDVALRDLLGEVDLSISICSTGLYEALIAGVPGVIVGCLPGSSVGFFSNVDGGADALGLVVKGAIDEGFTEKKRQLFANFIGYSLSHYFFAHGRSACPLVQRGLDQAVDEVFSRC